MRFRPLRPLCWRHSCVLAAALFVAASVCVPLFSQHRLLVPSPFGEHERFEVLAFEGSLCVVDLGFAIERLASSRYVFEETAGYADGFIELNSPQGYILQDKRETRFEFSVKVRPSRDYEDCFVVLRLFAQDGRELLLPYEIEPLRAGKAQTVRMRPELAYGDLNRGVYYYHFFSGGEEIYYAPTQLELGKKRPRPLPLRQSGNRDPELEQSPSFEVPETLARLVSDSEALVALGVNDSGFSVDHLVLAASNPTAERVALDLVKNARFSPALEEGIYVRRDMLLRVRFDARGQYRLIPE